MSLILWPWPRAFLSLASRGTVLEKAVLGLGLGLETCVLDSTSAIYVYYSKLFLDKNSAFYCFVSKTWRNIQLFALFSVISHDFSTKCWFIVWWSQTFVPDCNRTISGRKVVIRASERNFSRGYEDRCRAPKLKWSSYTKNHKRSSLKFGLIFCPKLGEEKKKVFTQIWSHFYPKSGEEQKKVFTQIWSQFLPKIRWRA